MVWCVCVCKWGVFFSVSAARPVTVCPKQPLEDEELEVSGHDDHYALKNGPGVDVVGLGLKQLKHNAGEVCFPGGKSDRNDTDEIHTALREAEEEIGLPPVGVEVVCRFTPILNQRGLLVTPVVGFISESFSARPNPAEFTDEYLRRIPNGEWPRVIVVADGSCGDSCSVLGISSEYNVESCHAYGANATIERLDQRQVPTPEIRAHSLYFDLSAYGIDAIKEPRSSSQASAKPGFHLKIYGTFRNRYMALACTSADSKMMRFLRHTASSSVRLLHILACCSFAVQLLKRTCTRLCKSSAQQFSFNLFIIIIIKSISVRFVFSHSLKVLVGHLIMN
uniref:Si:dkey-234i14.6 n=1 Tax=Astyanax mexicanus TaxID=7994 RepID=A0A3B1K925_ASTMX